MRKTNNTAGHTLLAAAAGLIAAATLTGCGAADGTQLPDRSGHGRLVVEVTDNGFGEHGTRTADEGWRTTFTSGDRVGLYAVKAGKVITDNLCLILRRSTWDEETTQPLYYEAGVTYYAYYPWQADMEGKIDAAAENADAFFAPLVAEWTPAADQSTHEAYSACDLMIGTGTVGDVYFDKTRILTLPLSHRMAVAAVRMPDLWYTTPDGFAYSMPIPIPVDVEFTWGGAECKPYLSERGLYRILYHPDWPAEVRGVFEWEGSTGSFAFNADVSASSYKVYRVDRSIADCGERAIEAGDLYYADGSILPVETAAKMAAGTAPRGCIGIVFQTDPNRISEAEKELFADKSMTVHGIAMSVKSAGEDNFHKWYYDSSKPEPDSFTRDESIEDPNYPGYTLPHIYDADIKKWYALANADINGYFNTQVIKVRRAGDFAAGLYPAFKAAADYSMEAGGPEQGVFTSGWYLPSIGQWFDFLRNVAKTNIGAGNLLGNNQVLTWRNQVNIGDVLNAAVSAIHAEDKTNFLFDRYWFNPSSNASPSWALNISFNAEGTINCAYIDKKLGYRIRCAIAF